jgi:uncharacterized protein
MPDNPAISAAVTRVVTHELRPGEEDAFLAWQERFNRAAAQLPGFLGLELIGPAPDSEGHQWATLYRFATPEQLEVWLNSEARADAIADEPDIFTAPSTQYTVAGGARRDTAETIIASHVVKPGAEADYHRANDALNQEAARFPGFAGVDVLPGPAGSNEFITLVRFDSREHMQTWLDSPVRARGREHLYATTEQQHHKVVATGFGSWFAINAVDGVAAAAWKQAMVVLSVLFAVVMTLNLTVGRLLDDAGVALAPAVFIGNFLSTVVLTWLAMPIVTRLMDWWLSPRCSLIRTLQGLALLAALYAAELAAFSAISS